MDKKKKQKEINKRIVETLRYGFSVKRVIHKGWEEHQKAMKEIPAYKKLFLESKGNPNGYFGKYQYFYSSNVGDISLIKLLDYGVYGIGGGDIWEIYSNDKIFRDVERFKTKKEAVKRIKRLLLR